MRRDELEIRTVEFLQFCKESRSLSRNTLLAYEQDLKCFTRFTWRSADEPVLTSSAVLSFLCFLRDELLLRPTTIRRRMLTLRAFCAWLEKAGAIEASPFSGLDLDLKLPRRLPRPVDRITIRRLLDQHPASPSPDCGTSVGIEPAIATGVTTALAIRLLIATGVRVGELTNIRLRDVLDSGRKLRIRGKGNRERTVFIGNHSLLRDLRAYLDTRLRANPTHDFLLLNRRGGRLTEQAVRARLRKLSADFGIRPHLTPHRFRHSAATLLIEEGVDIRFVQRLLGHSSITTTELYTQVSDTSLMSALQAADPLRKLQTEFT